MFKVYGERCYLCRCPLDLKTMEVDHLIPESLLEKPEELAQVIRSFALPGDFDLNSYENWQPSCRTCNNQKRAKVFEAAPIMLDQFVAARDGASTCREIENATVRDRDLATSLTHLERAMSRDELNLDLLLPLITAFAKSNPDALEEVLHASRDSGKIYMGFQLRRKPIDFLITPDLRIRFSGGKVFPVVTSAPVRYA